MKLVNKGKEGIILLCLLFPLSGCLNQGSSAGAESTAQDPVMNTIVERAFPFEENVTDVTLFFKEQEDIFDSDDPKESLVLDKTDAASISRTKDLVDIGGANKVRSNGMQGWVTLEDFSPVRYLRKIGTSEAEINSYIDKTMNENVQKFIPVYDMEGNVIGEFPTGYSM